MSSNSQNPTQVWIIGRATDCDVVSAEPTVSGHHCRLIREGDHYWVEDLHSPNGIYVNGTRVPAGQMVHLPPGAQVTLGRQVPMPWPMTNAAPSGSGYGFASSSDAGPASIAAPPPGSRVITIGRAPGSDTQVDLPIVSWNHARI